ncbi:MAG: hypothetical protein US58_C0007G0018 [Candidatus Magasanikbacteria bacterium GW2011_GWA2_37_8]|uniref:Uncharacterized protein n=1 Tax=Candidatus Magasanikbacteria bacterium GW2011_GWA2_37_8 TaxID=1619036 RepID=A0A0G0HFM3_9BACT|nr:MAG: hypothetical protein US58_C0007G0018 [Candidatus Magasanikbacteria bacterium GW2011_GWA2_37_8]
MNKKEKIIIPALLVVLAITSRFIPHLANFTTVGAVALFAGLYLPKKWSLILPITIMFISDIFIGFYSWPIMLSVYTGFVLMVLIGLLIKDNKSIATVFGSTLLGGFLFFLITNWSVWVFSTMYSPTISGLLESYYYALPFWRNMMVGDMFYVTILVGGYELVKLAISNKQLATNN